MLHRLCLFEATCASQLLAADVASMDPAFPDALA